MKKILIFLLSSILLATACNQSGTNPTPPITTPTYSLDSTYYFKITFNSQTLKDYAVKENSLGYVHFPGGQIINVQPYYDFGANNATPNIFLQSGNVKFEFNVVRNGSSLGTYDSLFNGNSSAFEITDLNTSKVYDVDTATISIIVNNINLTSITGIMSGNLIDGVSLIPFTGSFCLKRLL